MFTITTPKDGAPLKTESDFTGGKGALVGDTQDGKVVQHAGYVLFNVKVVLN